MDIIKLVAALIVLIIGSMIAANVFDLNTDIFYPLVLADLSVILSLYLTVTQAIETVRIKDYIVGYRIGFLLLYIVSLITSVAVASYLTLRLQGIDNETVRAFGSYMGRIGMLSMLVALTMTTIIAKRRKK